MSKGRPKGYSPYTEITYGELGDWLGRKALVKVSKAWLEELTSQACSLGGAPHSSKDITLKTEEEPKIEFTLTDFNNDD